MGKDFSIDPGTNATGWCEWIDGKAEATGTIRTEGETFLEKFYDLKRKLTDLFSERGDGDIERIAVEKFEVYHGRVKKEAGEGAKAMSMDKAATVRGLILALADDWAREPVIEISKRQITKADTALLCQSMGIKATSKDARDAVQIGVCAGFDRRRRA